MSFHRGYTFVCILALFVGFAGGRMGNSISSPPRLYVPRDDFTSNASALLVRTTASDTSILGILTESSKDSGAVRLLLESASDEELNAVAGRASAVFWKENRCAYPFFREFARRKFAPNGVAGVHAGRQFLVEHRIDGEPYSYFRTLIEGCLIASTPLASSLAEISKEWDCEQIQILVENYLECCGQESLTDLRNTANELTAGKPAFNPNSDFSARIKNAVARAWLVKGALGIEDELRQGTKVHSDIGNAVRVGIARLVATNPKRAKAILQRLANKSPSLSGEIFLSSRLPFRVLPELCESLPEADRVTFYESLAKTFGRASPLLLREALEEFPSSAVPRKALLGFVQTGLGFSPSEIVQWLSPLGDEVSASLLDDSMQGWSTSGGAEQFLSLRMPLGHFNKTGIIEGCLLMVARSTVDRAKALAEILPEKERDQALQRIYSDTLARALSGGADFFQKKVETIPAGNLDSALKAAARGASLTENIDVMQITEALRSGQRGLFLSEILATMSGGESYGCTKLSAKSCEWAAAKLIAEPFRPEYLKGIATFGQVLAQSDPMKALQYVNWIPPGRGREQAMAPVVQSWAESNPASACNWAESLPPGRERDIAISLIVKSAPAELDIGLRSLRAISSSDVRAETLRSLAIAWASADPTRFDLALASAGIAESERAELKGLNKLVPAY